MDSTKSRTRVPTGIARARRRPPFNSFDDNRAQYEERTTAEPEADEKSVREAHWSATSRAGPRAGIFSRPTRRMRKTPGAATRRIAGPQARRCAGDHSTDTFAREAGVRISPWSPQDQLTPPLGMNP